MANWKYVKCSKFSTNSKIEMVEHSMMHHSAVYSRHFILNINTQNLRLKKKVLEMCE